MMTPPDLPKRKNETKKNRRLLLLVLLLVTSLCAIHLLWPSSPQRQSETDLPTARLIYSRGYDLLVSLNVETGQETSLLYAGSLPSTQSSIKFSPDGKWEAYWRELWHGGVTFSELFMISQGVGGGMPKYKSLGQHYGATYFISWSPDSQWVAFSAEPEPLADIFYDNRQDWREEIPILEEEIYLINIDTYVEKRLTDNAFRDRYPAISPDGTQIVYTSDASGEDRLYLMDIATRESHVLLPDRDGYMPSWSSDGRWIAFVTTCAEGYNVFDGCGDLWIIRADGTGAQSVKTDTGPIETFWLP